MVKACFRKLCKQLVNPHKRPTESISVGFVPVGYRAVLTQLGAAQAADAPGIVQRVQYNASVGEIRGVLFHP